MPVIAKLILAILAIALIGNKGLYAQNLEQVHLKDGSVIEGYICEQIPGKNIRVQANKATIVVSADSLVSSSETLMPVSGLDDEWKSWIMEQETTPNALKIADLKFPNTEYKNVHLLKEGEEIVFLSVIPKQYVVEWNKVEKTEKSLRPVDQFSGLDDVLEMNDGSKHVGQVVEQIPGKTIKINKSKDEAITVNASQVAEMTLMPITDKLDIIEQSPFLDRIYVEGNPNPIDGLIVRRRPSKDLTILTKIDGERTYPIKDIIKYQKFKNTDHKVIRDKILEKNEVIINGNVKNARFINLGSVREYLILENGYSMEAKKGEDLILEANLENQAIPIHLIKAYRKNIAGPKTTTKVMRDVFTYRDFVENSLPVNRSITPNGNTKIEYPLEESGDYVISIQGQRGFIIIHVE